MRLGGVEMNNNSRVIVLLWIIVKEALDLLTKLKESKREQQNNTLGIFIFLSGEISNETLHLVFVVQLVKTVTTTN